MSDSPASAEELRSLRRWLLDEPEFHGRVRLRQEAPRPGEMGPDTASLLLTLASTGGAALCTSSVRTMGSVLITWLRARTSQVGVTVRRADGAAVSLTADGVRDMPADGVARMLDDLTARLD